LREREKGGREAISWGKKGTTSLPRLVQKTTKDGNVIQGAREPEPASAGGGRGQTPFGGSRV